LEPWLGLDLVFDDLPIPRLIELTISDPSQVDFIGLSSRLQADVKGAILDNHRFWVERLRSMAETAILIGFTILFLVLAATVLTVIFATRSAMAGNQETIAVLHFVGASNRFIASEFQRKFFTLGLKGSLAGGMFAILTFVIFQLLLSNDTASAAADQMQALLGVIELDLSAYLATLALTFVIAILTAITTRLTVMKTLSKLH
jgi:cell division transport system permease protein